MWVVGNIRGAERGKMQRVAGKSFYLIAASAETEMRCGIGSVYGSDNFLVFRLSLGGVGLKEWEC